MSWLLFLDESGHDHKSMPYEVRGGIALQATKLWPFNQAMRKLEEASFGTHLAGYGSEVKGSKLLQPARFRWAAQGPRIEPDERRRSALNFLNSSAQSRIPRRHEFTAYGQACIQMAEETIRLLWSHEAVLFAAIIPRTAGGDGISPEFLRKDHVFLLERFFYFLENKQQMGLLVMDETDKNEDRRFVRRLERYFTLTQTGRHRTQWIVPSPFFVESDMSYGVQVADVCIYCLNLGYRLQGMIEPTRPELDRFGRALEQLIWHGEGYRDGIVFKTSSVTYVPDPYTPRRPGGAT